MIIITFIGVVLQIILILVLIRINQISLQRQLLDEEDKMLVEFCNYIPEILNDKIYDNTTKKKQLLPYLPYLSEEMFKMIDKTSKEISNSTNKNEIIEDGRSYCHEFEMLILNRRIEIKNEKEKLTKFWKFK